MHHHSSARMLTCAAEMKPLPRRTFMLVEGDKKLKNKQGNMIKSGYNKPKKRDGERPGISALERVEATFKSCLKG